MHEPAPRVLEYTSTSSDPHCAANNTIFSCEAIDGLGRGCSEMGGVLNCISLYPECILVYHRKYIFLTYPIVYPGVFICILSMS